MVRCKESVFSGSFFVLKREIGIGKDIWMGKLEMLRENLEDSLL